MYNKCVRRGRLALYAFFSLSFLISYAQPASILAGDKRLVFCTWEGFEVDKCASIWLIKRFVDNNAVINFFPKGEAIKKGIPSSLKVCGEGNASDKAIWDNISGGCYGDAKPKPLRQEQAKKDGGKKVQERHRER